MNSTLEEIWSARALITEECHTSAEELIAYYQERQKVHSTRLVRPPKREYEAEFEATSERYTLPT